MTISKVYYEMIDELDVTNRVDTLKQILSSFNILDAQLNEGDIKVKTYLQKVLSKYN